MAYARRVTVCPACGAENPPGFSFCGRCGATLAEGAEPARELRKTVTVLFCDLTGSTSLGERLDAEAFRAAMRRYYDEARTILERHGGTVEKFIGDAVMAVFGVPQAHEDDALRAVRAASELREAVFSQGLRARVGVNTGEVVAGEGDSLVTGDAVNVAARLEQAAEPGEILLGEATRLLVRDAVTVEGRSLELKGKRAPVRAYRLETLDPEAPGLLRRLDSPLVGRTRELQRLQDDFEQTMERRSSYLFTLLGPAGVGKSRLVAEFCRDVGPRARVVRGRCLHYGEGITYWPLVEVLVQLGVEPQPVLALPSPTEAAVATRKVLERVAAERPLVVVWDDIQWGEPAFLDLIEHIADWSRAAPIFLLCIARPELLDQRPAWGGGKPNATSLLLEPLREEEALALIDNLAGSSALAPPVRERILRAAEGNPLFVEEMLLMIGAAGAETIDVPPTIHALLQARLDRLPDEERSVIERGAVEGEVFHRSPVAELAPERVRVGLDGHLTKLIRNELIRPETATMPGDDAFRFRHLLIRDAAYDALPKETRADLHERFAIWVEEHAQLVEQDEIVGYHLEQAVLYRRELGISDVGLAERAGERLGSTGRAARARGDNTAAARLLARAAKLLDERDPRRLELFPDLTLALIDLGQLPEAQVYTDELAAAEGEHWRAYAWALSARLDALSGAGSYEAARPGLAAAVETFERLGDERGLALALLMQGDDEWSNARALAAAEKYRLAIPHAERAGDTSLVDDAISTLCAIVAFGPVHIDEAEEEARALLERSNGIIAETAAYRTLARLAAIRGDIEEAHELIRRGREPLRDAGLELWYAATSLPAAFVEAHAGDFDAVVRIYEEGFARLEELREHAFASTIAADLGMALLELGRDDEAAPWFAKARELGPSGDVATVTIADIGEGLLHARRGELDEAERLVRSGLRHAETTDFWEFQTRANEALAEVLHLRGRADEARAALTTALAKYEAKGAEPAAERVRRLLAEL
jgi:class 3 adenylate cyclase/tetratricopeptide (TPR) repeat protein